MTTQKPYASREAATHAAGNAMVRITNYVVAEGGKLELPANVTDNMHAVGFTDTQIQQVVAMAIGIGIKFPALSNLKNIPVLRNAWELVTHYGYRPGHDFYIVPFKDKDDVIDLALVRSINVLQANAEMHARLNGFAFRIQKRDFIDPAKAAEMIRFLQPNAVDDPGNRLVAVRVKILGETYELDEGWHYGYYLEKGHRKEKQDGGSYITGSDRVVLSVGNANRQAVDVAYTRAMRKALREVTRTDYPLDQSAIEDRVAYMLADVSTRLQNRSYVLTAADAIPDDEPIAAVDGAPETETAAEVGGNALKQSLSQLLEGLEDVEVEVKILEPAETPVFLGVDSFIQKALIHEDLDAFQKGLIKLTAAPDQKELTNTAAIDAIINQACNLADGEMVMGTHTRSTEVILRAALRLPLDKPLLRGACGELWKNCVRKEGESNVIDVESPGYRLLQVIGEQLASITVLDEMEQPL